MNAQSNNTTTYWVYRDNYPVYRHAQHWAAKFKAEEAAQSYPSSRVEIKKLTVIEEVVYTIEPRTPHQAKQVNDA